jgi:hypothetical protein
MIRGLLGARDLQSLAPFQYLDIFAGFEQAFVGARVEPSKAAAHILDCEAIALHIGPVDIGEFELAARGGF